MTIKVVKSNRLITKSYRGCHYYVFLGLLYEKVCIIFVKYKQMRNVDPNDNVNIHILRSSLIFFSINLHDSSC